MWQREQVFRVLQKSGKRITPQRKVLIDVILEEDWSSCKEIYYEAVKRDPSIGVATVYRMLGTLEEVGVLTRGHNYLFSSREQRGERRAAL